jgi:hypothetical protein
LRSFEAISNVETMTKILGDPFSSVFSTHLSSEATAHCSEDESVEIDKVSPVEQFDDLIVTDQDALEAIRDLRLSSSPDLA